MAEALWQFLQAEAEGGADAEWAEHMVLARSERREQYVSVHVYLYVYVYVHAYVYVFVFVCVYLCVCMYVYVCMYGLCSTLSSPLGPCGA